VAGDAASALGGQRVFVIGGVQAALVAAGGRTGCKRGSGNHLFGDIRSGPAKHEASRAIAVEKLYADGVRTFGKVDAAGNLFHGMRSVVVNDEEVVNVYFRTVVALRRQRPLAGRRHRDEAGEQADEASGKAEVAKVAGRRVVQGGNRCLLEQRERFVHGKLGQFIYRPRRGVEFAVETARNLHLAGQSGCRNDTLGGARPLPLEYHTTGPFSVEVFDLDGVSALRKGHFVCLLHGHALQPVVVDNELVIDVAAKRESETKVQGARARTDSFDPSSLVMKKTQRPCLGMLTKPLNTAAKLVVMPEFP
jgi:hypothetical protein